MSLPYHFYEDQYTERRPHALLISAPGLMSNALQAYLRSVQHLKLTCDHMTPVNYLLSDNTSCADVVIILEDRNLSEAAQVLEAAQARRDHFLVIVPDTYRQFSLQQMIVEPVLVWSLLNLTFETTLAECIETSPHRLTIQPAEWNALQPTHS